MRLGLVPCLLLWGCASAAPLPPRPQPPASIAAGPKAAARSSPVECASEPRAIGRVQDPELDEISGVVESSRQPGVFFVHNDSGDSPRFFALAREGRVLAELRLDSVPVLLDAEDIATGPAPDGGSFLYLGDTGNNFASMGLGIPRRKAVIYRVREPAISEDMRRAEIVLRDVFPIVFTFPNGARDVEAFFVDPLSGELVLIAKQPDGRSQILTAPAAMLNGGGGELRLAGEVMFGRGGSRGSKMPTAASISRDGTSILIRTYDTVLLVRRAPSESVAQALGRPAQPLPAPHENQGEAIAFTEHDTAFVTISEGFDQSVNCGRLPQITSQINH